MDGHRLARDGGPKTEPNPQTQHPNIRFRAPSSPSTPVVSPPDRLVAIVLSRLNSSTPTGTVRAPGTRWRQTAVGQRVSWPEMMSADSMAKDGNGPFFTALRWFFFVPLSSLVVAVAHGRGVFSCSLLLRFVPSAQPSPATSYQQICFLHFAFPPVRAGQSIGEKNVPI